MAHISDLVFAKKDVQQRLKDEPVLQPLSRFQVVARKHYGRLAECSVAPTFCKCPPRITAREAAGRQNTLCQTMTSLINAI